MISRRAFLAAAPLPLLARQKPPRMGLEIYSLRTEAEKDLPGTLAMIRKFGFTEVEVPSLYGRDAAGFRRLLDDAGLRATSVMAEYARLDVQIDSVLADAHALGAEYVVCSSIPHKKQLSTEECYRAIGQFDRWGETLAAQGLHLCYHTHGVEFANSSDGTLFDTLVKRTDARFVNFEMDVFWIVFAFQNPVKMLHRYPGRFPLMHVKDMRKDTPRGGSPGDVLEEASVALGTGLVDIPAVLRAAEKTGVRHYYIEDEAADAARQIPESLRYLESVRP